MTNPRRVDPLIRAELQTELKDLFAELGKTVVLVTHDLAEAAYLAGDDIVLLKQGQIEQRGTFASIRDEPESEFVGLRRRSDAASRTSPRGQCRETSPADRPRHGRRERWSVRAERGDRRVVVASKKFTESVILGELITQVLRAEGVEARHRRELGGSRALQRSYPRRHRCLPEYTGTLMGELLVEEIFVRSTNFVPRSNPRPSA